jgi:hypothetical protein
MKFEPLTDDDLATATGGQMLRNYSALNTKLKTQLDTLTQSVKDVATAGTTSQTQQQQQSLMLMAMMMARR